MTADSDRSGQAPLVERATRGRATASECLTLLNRGLRPEPGRIAEALGHLRAALGALPQADGPADPETASTALLLGELLMSAYPDEPAALIEARRMLRWSLQLAEAGGQVGLPDAIAGRLHAEIVVAGSVLMAQAQHQTGTAALAAEQDVFVADCLAYLNQPDGDDTNRRDSVALLMNALAQRSRDPSRRRSNDLDELLRLSRARPAGTPLSSDHRFAVQSALVVAQVLALGERRDGSDEHLTEAVRLLDDHRELVEAGELDLAAHYDALFASLIAHASPGSAVAGRRADALRRCEQAIIALPPDDPTVPLLRRLRKVLEQDPSRRVPHRRDQVVASEVVAALEEVLLRSIRGTGAVADDVLPAAGLNELIDALQQLELDALVYLLPRGFASRGVAEALVGSLLSDRYDDGCALVVSREGTVAWMNLPGLTLDPGQPVAQYAQAHRELLRAAGQGPAAGLWREQLTMICEWAWETVVGGLAALVVPTIPGLPSRVALVPFGALAVVPWQAAYPAPEPDRPNSGGQPAVARFVFSFAAAGSLLVRTVGRHPRRLADYPILVADPDGDLPATRPEVRALVESGGFRYAEVLNDARGSTLTAVTPDRLLAALSRQGCSLLHFAGALRFDPDNPGLSGLRMGGETLTAYQIMRMRPGEFGYCVTLSQPAVAAFGSADEDPVVIPAAFLVGGATTVFGTLWRMDDAAATVQIFMLYHHLAAGLAPAEALQRTQLWMRNPGRSVPAALPPDLSRVIETTDLTDPVAWAGMVHHGR